MWYGMICDVMCYAIDICHARDYYTLTELLIRVYGTGYTIHVPMVCMSTIYMSTFLLSLCGTPFVWLAV